MCVIFQYENDREDPQTLTDIDFNLGLDAILFRQEMKSWNVQRLVTSSQVAQTRAEVQMNIQKLNYQTVGLTQAGETGKYSWRRKTIWQRVTGNVVISQ